MDPKQIDARDVAAFLANADAAIRNQLVDALMEANVSECHYAEHGGMRFVVTARDPGQGDAVGRWVVVRENGRFVVDLVATAALHAQPGAVTGPGQLEPRELTPQDWDRIHARELATPPGEPVR